MEINGKDIAEFTFDQIVDYVAGNALTQLIKGQQWRSIIFEVANVVAYWSASKPLDCGD